MPIQGELDNRGGCYTEQEGSSTANSMRRSPVHRVGALKSALMTGTTGHKRSTGRGTATATLRASWHRSQWGAEHGPPHSVEHHHARPSVGSHAQQGRVNPISGRDARYGTASLAGPIQSTVHPEHNLYSAYMYIRICRGVVYTIISYGADRNTYQKKRSGRTWNTSVIPSTPYDTTPTLHGGANVCGPPI